MALFIALVLFVSFDTPKEETPVYKLSEPQTLMLYSGIEQVKKGLPTSATMTGVEITNTLMIMDSIQRVLSSQYMKFHPAPAKASEPSKKDK